MGEAATITSDLVGGDLEAPRALGHMMTLADTMTGAIADHLLG
jgi:hypothetical protein